MKESSVHERKRPLGAGGAIVAGVAGALLGAGIWYAFWGWDLADAVKDVGLASLALGAVLSVVLGGGLMALLFWSHRKGYDR